MSRWGAALFTRTFLTLFDTLTFFPGTQCTRAVLTMENSAGDCSGSGVAVAGATTIVPGSSGPVSALVATDLLRSGLDRVGSFVCYGDGDGGYARCCLAVSV